MALPSPAVVLSARLNRYCDHLRLPSGWLPFPGSSPVIGRRAPAVIRSPLGRGGPLQFPPPLSERSEPLTPRSPSRLRFQALHRFLGLRPSTPGSALPAPHPSDGSSDDAAASLHVTDRSVAHPHTGVLDAGLRPARFQTKPPACYRASWQLPGPDFHRQATTSLRDQSSTTHMINHQSLLDAP